MSLFFVGAIKFDIADAADKDEGSKSKGRDKHKGKDKGKHKGKHKGSKSKDKVDKPGNSSSIATHTKYLSDRHASSK